MNNNGDSDSLRNLQQDLLALSEARLKSVERLLHEAEVHIANFKQLLDKPTKKDASRQSVLSGKITLDQNEYAVNQDFQQEALQLADLLNLDELEAGRLLLQARNDAQELDRTIFESAVFNFHERRLLLLDTLRLLLSESASSDDDEDPFSDARDGLREGRRLLLTSEGCKPMGGAWFAQKCMQAMRDIEEWLQRLYEQVQAALVMGDQQGTGTMEMIEFQRKSLERQHESLGAIICHLIKAGYSTIKELNELLQIVKKLDKLDAITIHYIPALMISMSHHGSSDGHLSAQEASSLHQRIITHTDGDRWSLRSFHCAVICWWLVEYEGWHLDEPSDASQESKLAKEKVERSRLFMQCLKEYAFRFMLSLCVGITPEDDQNPSRHDLLQVLFQDPPVLISEPIPTSDFFQSMLMERFQSFVDGFINNMPNTVRNLRDGEEDQDGQTEGGATLSTSQLNAHNERMYLQNFEVIVAYAFEGHPEESQAFWEDPDSSLSGFLQWASIRESAPQVSAFSEMFCAVSKGEENATAAHTYLLLDGEVPAHRGVRRTTPLSWAQIFAELDQCYKQIHDRPLAEPPLRQAGKPNQDVIRETESLMIITCYLRLTAHLCRESSTVRKFILEHPTYHLEQKVLQLTTGATSTIPPYLRACVFDLLQALLIDKSPELGFAMWTSLDQWLSTGPLAVPNRPKSAHPPQDPRQPVEPIEKTMLKIALNIQEVSSFLGLLQALISPSPEDPTLKDSLSFPERLGSSYRMPGVDPYIDLVFRLMIELAGAQNEISDKRQLNLLNLNIFNFIATCLSNFNENIAIMASRPNLSIDSGIRASSPSTYVRLHPFGHVMEWIMTEKVANLVCRTVNQDVVKVTEATPDSPLYLALLRNIESIVFAMDLQATYVEIVRPILKAEFPNRKTLGADLPLASFEESIVNNLHLVAVLGLYCGTGHQDLTLVSLSLLQRLCSSRRLNSIHASSKRYGSNISKIVEIVELDMESERIARALNKDMKVDLHELELGPESAAHTLKLAILQFLSTCLDSTPGRPTISHLLLGFSCARNGLEVASGSTFEKGLSLFHTILQLVQEYPYAENGLILGWLLHLRVGCLRLLQQLWSSILSCSMTVTEFRVSGFLFHQFTMEEIVSPMTLWDGLTLNDLGFYFSDSARCLADFLRQRAYLFNYACTDLGLAAAEKSGSQKTLTIATLLGMTPTSEGEPITHTGVLDLFDFADLDMRIDIQPPELVFFRDMDLKYAVEDEYEGLQTLNLPILEELIQYNINTLLSQQTAGEQFDEGKILDEAQVLCSYIQACNQRILVRKNRSLALKNWSRLIAVVLERGDLDPKTKSTFVLQALQLITPKLDLYMDETHSEALQLAELAETLLYHLDLQMTSLEDSRASDLAGERAFELFRTCLRGVRFSGATWGLRAACYGVCGNFLTRIIGQSTVNTTLRRQSMSAIKASGERLFNVICEDAYTGDQNSRLPALLLLDALVSLARHQDSQLVVEILYRINFISLLVESLKHISEELRDTDVADVPFLFSSNNARLSLLLNISRTRAGANHVYNAGIFQAIQASQLFTVDPDLGVDVENPTALLNFYALLQTTISLITSIVLSRGENNTQTLDQGRKFLTNNRYSIVGVFKREAGIGVGDKESVQGGVREVLMKLVQGYTILMSLVGWIDFEEEGGLKRSTSTQFT
ncbi:MAG: hypothetical protein M1834_001021 [Cirrosporium novae-zelandiae]|nr:MAG: hypothetical protein M1834_001021 [Cirrosporium novae-zelandiae]